MPPDPLLTYPDAQNLPDGGFALSSPAKINLCLRILGKRPDGFHDLDTIFQEIDWSDLIEFHESSEWSLEIHGMDLDPGPQNLVVRAAEKLSRVANLPCHARIVLHKEIPIGGGLGGGSSNAAITLLGLSRLWKLNWDTAKLQPLAAEIGSDCAFFLYGGMARGTGRGERLTLLEGNLDKDIVVIVPPFGVSTAWAYEAGQFPLTDDEKSVILQFYPKDSICPLSASQDFHNDLENIVLKKYADLAGIKQKLYDLGAMVSMLSGSGSCMLGIFEQRSRALHAAQQFEKPFYVRICRTVKRRREP